MRRILSLCIAMLLLALGARAQDAQLCKLPASLDQLKTKAAEASDITLDANMLKMATGAINKDKGNEADIQRILSGLKGICVRSYKFDKETQYDEKDVDALRSQFSDSSWSSIVKVRNKRDGENVDVFVKTEKGALAGIAVIAVKPVEFTIVRIDGSIDLAQLGKLGGQFGIPKLNIPGGQSKPAPQKESK